MIKIRNITDISELDSIRQDWVKWQNHPNNDLDHFMLVCRLRNEIQGFNIISVEKNDRPCFLLAARLENANFTFCMGYFKIIKIPAKVYSFIYRGLIGNFDDKIEQALALHIKSIMVKNKADATVFHNLSEDSPLLGMLLNTKNNLFIGKKLIWNLHWEMKLADSEGYLLKSMKSKHRAWIRSRQKKLNEDFNKKATWQWYREFEDLNSLLIRIEKIASSTYHRGLGVGFINDEEHRQRYSLFSKQGKLRILTLEIDGDIKAFWIGIIFGHVYHSSETGYSPELSKYEVGTLAFLNMVDELIREGINSIDFGLGDAYYKHRFGNHSWRETTVKIFSKRVKGIALKCFSETFDHLNFIITNLLKKVKLNDKLKKTLRSRLKQ